MRIKFFAFLLALFATPAFAAPLALELDQAKPLIFKKPATGVVVGNAGIADVIVHDSKTIIVMGKSIGTTHVLILGEKGQTLYSGNVVVSPGPTNGLLTVQKGVDVKTSMCNVRCIDVISPEDTMAPLNDTLSKIRARGSFTEGN
ncbi:MAG: pilus assembly protein N-terminal domain-containing protein [Caulobacterales bacterium]|nr:pilus assembly protein N-terminal domain-containing protein [Caulobacterales bacterium]